LNSSIIIQMKLERGHIQDLKCPHGEVVKWDPYMQVLYYIAINEEEIPLILLPFI